MSLTSYQAAPPRDFMSLILAYYFGNATKFFADRPNFLPLQKEMSVAVGV